MKTVRIYRVIDGLKFFQSGDLYCWCKECDGVNGADCIMKQLEEAGVKKDNEGNFIMTKDDFYWWKEHLLEKEGWK